MLLTVWRGFLLEFKVGCVLSSFSGNVENRVKRVKNVSKEFIVRS